MPDLAIESDQRPPYRRRWLLRRPAELGLEWWTYESENPAGAQIGGTRYDETSYTLKMPTGLRVTLVASEVEGWVLHKAVAEDRVDDFRYRRGLPGDDQE